MPARPIIALALALALAAVPSSPVSAQQAEILVSAASSLTEALNSLKAGAETYIGARIAFNFGASGSLRKQIEEGAPVDLFFSASSEDMDALEKAGLIRSGSRRDLLTNSIVLVGERGQGQVSSLAGLKARLEAARLVAIGNPDTVPAGRYAVQALKTLGLYGLVEGKLVLGGNVKEVLQFLDSLSAPLGIVFQSDALSLKDDSPVARLYQFPESSLETPVLYPAAVVAGSRGAKYAAKLVEFLQGPSARAAFVKAGFGLR